MSTTRTVYDNQKKDFVRVTEVRAVLTYRSDGEPIALLIDDAHGDRNELKAWLRAMFLRTRNEDPSPAIWYLGSPYSHPDREVMDLRYRHACQAAARLFERSIFTYGPIAHTVAIDSEGGLEASDFEPWRIFDLGMIDRCTGLMVLMLDGWEQSKGLTAEIEHARTTGKPILWIEPRFEGDRVTGYHMHEQQPEAALQDGTAS